MVDFPRVTTWVACSLAAFGCYGRPAMAPALESVSVSDDDAIHSLTIGVHRKASLKLDVADHILSKANFVLQSNDGVGDTECRVALERKGPVRSFSEGNGTIDSRKSFEQVMSQPGTISVVASITWCSKKTKPGFLGCSRMSGDGLAVVRLKDRLEEGVLWAHELGHNQGLGDRHGHSYNVMSARIDRLARRIGEDQCSEFRKAAPSAAAESAVSGAGAEPGPDSVEGFVKRHYVHGLPYGAVSDHFGPANLPELFAMLDDPDMAAYRSNIVGILGIIGGLDATEALISFIEDTETTNPVDLETYRAVIAATISLGYAANDPDDVQAIGFLEKTARRMGEPSSPEPRLDGAALGDASIQGLALSGRPEVGGVMRRLAAENGLLKSIQRAGLHEDTLSTWEEVRKDGLRAYYEGD